MDNRTIDVTAESPRSLEAAINIMWPNAAGGFATHYRVVKIAEKTTYYGSGDHITHRTECVEDDENGVETLIMYWSEAMGSSKLPFKLDAKRTPNFVSAWLEVAQYPEDPGIDGSCKKGFRLFTEGWGHVLGSPYAILAVQPAWAMYGK